MPTWPFWVLFLAVGALAVLVAKRLDDAERRRFGGRASSAPPDTHDQT